MQDALKTDFGLSARWLESASNDTHENAVFSAPLLLRANIHTIVLVTNVTHMARSRREFEARGMTVIPAGIGYRAQTPLTWFDWLPSAEAYDHSSFTLHEYLGLIWQAILLPKASAS